MKERLKQLRKALDLTQQQFADRIGSTQNNIANYETGRRNPSAAALNNICKEFNVNENWLRTGKGAMFIEVARDSQITTFVSKILSQESDSFKRRFITVLSQLEESDWLVLEKMALEMVEENRHDNKMEIAEETTPQIPSILNLPTIETDEDIEAELEDYRRQLLHEKAAAEKSRASQNSKDA